MAPVVIYAQSYISDCDKCKIDYAKKGSGTCYCGGFQTIFKQEFDKNGNPHIIMYKCDNRECNHIHTFKRVVNLQKSDSQKPSKFSDLPKSEEHKCTSICFVEEHKWILVEDSVVELNLRITNTCNAKKTTMYLIDSKDYTEPVKPGEFADYKKRFKEPKDITIAPTRFNTKVLKGKLTKKRPSKD